MSWASRRRTAYLSGVIVFFSVAIGGPLLFWWIASIPPACAIGTMRPSGFSNGSCSELDARYLQPTAVKWARSFKVRDGSYSSVAYIENPNPSAGVLRARYHMGLYDSGNILLAEREGETFIMPGGITPILETGIYTGNRSVVHTYFELTDPSLIWKQAESPAEKIKIGNQSVSTFDSTPRIEATARSVSLDTIRNISFVTVLFDVAGNAFAASGTALPELTPGASAPISFSWPAPFTTAVGRIDIIPLLAPALTREQ